MGWIFICPGCGKTLDVDNLGNSNAERRSKAGKRRELRKLRTRSYFLAPTRDTIVVCHAKHKKLTSKTQKTSRRDQGNRRLVYSANVYIKPKIKTIIYAC